MKGSRAGTHFLERGGCSVSVGAKQMDQGQALTDWRAEDMVCQQTQNRETKCMHSQAGEQRMQCISRCKLKKPRAGTHKLKSREYGVSGAKQRD
jgi:hypothetical protein